MQRHSWEQGVAAQVFVERGKDDNPLVIQMAKEAVLRQDKDGRLAIIGSDQGVTDPAANGEAVALAARLTGDSGLHEGAQRMLDYLLHKAPRSRDGILYHIIDKPQMWIDSMYMAPPFLAVMGYHNEAIKQIEGWRNRLWNAEHKLFSHIWDEDTQHFVREDFWGVGNGWAAAGMARVIRSLPQSMANDKARLVAYVRDVLSGCVAHLRPDGLFHNVVDNPDTFIETNLSQMLAHTIYSGVGEGWLDPNYTKAADTMRAAAHTKVDQYGLVQGVCGAPTFDHPGTAPEGQAFFLLMETSFAKLSQSVK